MQFYRRPLPDTCVPFSSDEGKYLFKKSLDEGFMESYFKLAPQFRTQDDPNFCGLSTLIMILNAFEIDPKRVWKGPWRWYHEDMLDCCVPLETVREKGLTFDQVICIAECNGLSVMHSCRIDENANKDDFKKMVAKVTSSSDAAMVVSFHRPTLNQTGGGHYSAVGAYCEEKDMVLILDTARFKYPPYWVKIDALWNSMKTIDLETNKERGFLVMNRCINSGPCTAFCVDERFTGSLLYPNYEFDDAASILHDAWLSWHEWLQSPFSGESSTLIESAVNVIKDGIAPNNFRHFFLRMHPKCIDADEERERIVLPLQQSEICQKVTEILKNYENIFPSSVDGNGAGGNCPCNSFDKICSCISMFLIAYPYESHLGARYEAMNAVTKVYVNALSDIVLTEIENIKGVFKTLVHLKAFGPMCEMNQ